jgi:hypothetical protein
MRSKWIAILVIVCAVAFLLSVLGKLGLVAAHQSPADHWDHRLAFAYVRRERLDAARRQIVQLKKQLATCAAQRDRCALQTRSTPTPSEWADSNRAPVTTLNNGFLAAPLAAPEPAVTVWKQGGLRQLLGRGARARPTLAGTQGSSEGTPWSVALVHLHTLLSPEVKSRFPPF